MSRVLASNSASARRLAYWRASSYYRTAGVMLIAAPLDPRLVESSHLQTATFQRGAALMEQPPEIIEIPFEDTTLPGYFFAVDDSERSRATVILTGGYDSTKEEGYFYNAAAALARGYNALVFDGPGQGAVLVDQGVPLRADWENVVTPVVDYAITRPDVDPARVALIGPSLGAHLAPRAASAEHRLAACIADCGVFDMYASFLSRLPGPLRSGFEAGHHTSSLDPKSLKDLYGSGALPINYPNAFDVRRGKTGSGIWLHGTPSSQFSRAPLATDGCIAVANPDLDRIIRTVEIRTTLVLIDKNLTWVTDQSLAAERKAFEALLRSWAVAKSAGEHARLLTYYAADFSADGKDLAAYASTLQADIARAKGRAFQLNDISFLRSVGEAEIMVATFGEVIAGSRAGRTIRQYWERRGTQWKILYEGIV